MKRNSLFIENEIFEQVRNENSKFDAREYVDPEKWYKPYKEYCAENGQKPVSLQNFKSDTKNILERYLVSGHGIDIELISKSIWSPELKKNHRVLMVFGKDSKTSMFDKIM